MARAKPTKTDADRRSLVTQRLAGAVADAVDEAADKVGRKVDEKRDQAQAKIEQKHRKLAEKIDRKRDQVLTKLEGSYPDVRYRTEDGGVYDFWVRERPGSRKPRFSHDEIAAGAMRVVDTEGLDALSMRRLAAELGAGTMTLYHYVQTKDELLVLLVDRVMGELIVPDDDFPADWREALTVIAHRTREVLQRHPWVFDISADPGTGPNGVHHFDQSLQALASLDLGLAEKLDILTAIDEYTFGHCLHSRTDASTAENDAEWQAMTDYFVGLVDQGGLPQLEALVDEHGPDELSRTLRDYERDTTRFARNLRRFLDGIEQDLGARG